MKIKYSNLLFSLSGSVALDNLASKELSSSCSLTIVALEEDDALEPYIANIGVGKEEDELSMASTEEDGFRLSSCSWVSFKNSQRVLSRQKSTGIISCLALELKLLWSPQSTIWENAIRNFSIFKIE